MPASTAALSASSAAISAMMILSRGVAEDAEKDGFIAAL
jgi:hypothetical protein